MDTKSNATALQHEAILELIRPHSTVLDLGCGDGDLMARLINEKQAHVQGIEVDEQAIYRCVGKGLSVFHGDIDSGLPDFKDKSFDYVVLNHSFQQVKHPEVVLEEALRVGARVIIGFPNFAHYSVRYQIAICGRTPVNTALPYQWYDTPNLHFLSLSDFTRFCAEHQVKIERSCYLGQKGRVRLFPNFFGLSGIFLVSKTD